jgi:hypothetical protein
VAIRAVRCVERICHAFQRGNDVVVTVREVRHFAAWRHRLLGRFR